MSHRHFLKHGTMLHKLCDFELIGYIFGASNDLAEPNNLISDNVNHPSCSYYAAHLISNLVCLYLALLLQLYHKCWQSGKCSKRRRGGGASTTSSSTRIPSKRGSNNGSSHHHHQPHNHQKNGGKRYSRAESNVDSQHISKLFQQRTVFTHHISIWSLTLVILVAVGADLSENIILHLHRDSHTANITTNEGLSSVSSRSSRVNRFISLTPSNLFENNDINDTLIDITASSDNYSDSYSVHSTTTKPSSVLVSVYHGENGSSNVNGVGGHRSARSSVSVDLDEDGHHHQIIYEYLKIIGPLVTLTVVSVFLAFYHQFERLGESKYLLINVFFFALSGIFFLTNVYLHWVQQALTLLHVKVLNNAVSAFASVILTALLARTLVHEVNYCMTAW